MSEQYPAGVSGVASYRNAEWRRGELLGGARAWAAQPKAKIGGNLNDNGGDSDRHYSAQRWRQQAWRIENNIANMAKGAIAAPVYVMP